MERDGQINVPTPVLVETITGDPGRDAETNRVLHVLSRAASALVVTDETLSRRAGKLRFRAGSDDGIDALVASVAVGDGSPCVLLTSDHEDMGRLVSNEANVSIRQV